MNPILGLGSYTMGDVAGGLIITALEGAAAGCVFWELSLNKDNDMYLVPGTIALAAGGTAVLFGILRPIFYHRTPSARRMAALMKGLDIALVQAAGLKTAPGVRLSYRFQF
ncbi:hypothetical protein AGMMS49944_26040 [Spirochaetia bacterium]|nr:hypothetical protein AGMMS49944_26040 [Spirochaetia bacterium]